MYWNGAALKGIYPASIVFDGFAMNITLVSYAKSLDFGIVACRRSLPEVQRMIDYLEEALVELEEVAGLAARSGKSKKVKKPAPHKSSGGKAKAGATVRDSSRAETKANKRSGPKSRKKPGKAKPKKAR